MEIETKYKQYPVFRFTSKGGLEVVRVLFNLESPLKDGEKSPFYNQGGQMNKQNTKLLEELKTLTGIKDDEMLIHIALSIAIKDFKEFAL